MSKRDDQINKQCWGSSVGPAPLTGESFRVPVGWAACDTHGNLGRTTNYYRTQMQAIEHEPEAAAWVQVTVGSEENGYIRRATPAEIKRGYAEVRR